VACAATAPAIAATGRTKNSTVSPVVIELASTRRPPSRRPSRAFHGASTAPISIAQTSGCQSGATICQTSQPSSAASASAPARSQKRRSPLAGASGLPAQRRSGSFIGAFTFVPGRG
jgi:hypothetical protein